MNINLSSINYSDGEGDIFSGINLSPGMQPEGDFSVVVAGDLAPVLRTDDLIKLKKYGDLIDENIRKEITNSDLSIVNLECPLTLSRQALPKIGPVLSGRPEAAEFLRYAGFKAVSLANNHIMDRGAQGLKDTLRICRDYNIMTVGAGLNIEDAERPLIMNVGNKKLAVFSICEQEFSAAGQDRPGANPVDAYRSYKTIRSYAEQVDFVLVIFHGGNEYLRCPRPGLIDTCRFFVDIGANAVVCHHAHVFSGVEIYKNAPIVYGTGNFLFDSKKRRPESWNYGYLVKFSAVAKQVVQFRLIPYKQSEKTAGVKTVEQRRENRMLNEITECSKTLTNSKVSQKEWDSFCEAQKTDILIKFIFPFRARGARRILKYFPGLFNLYFTKYRCLIMLNMLRCESHKEALINVLENRL